MIDFKLGDDGDITISEGKFELIETYQESVRQRLQVRLQTFLGEWFLDTSVGIPYRQGIFNKGLTKREVDAIFIREINKDPDVIRTISFSAVQIGRKYELDFEVQTKDGIIRVLTPTLTPNEEITYNPASDFVISPSCKTNEYSNAGDGIYAIEAT